MDKGADGEVATNGKPHVKEEENPQNEGCLLKRRADQEKTQVLVLGGVGKGNQLGPRKCCEKATGRGTLTGRRPFILGGRHNLPQERMFCG